MTKTKKRFLWVVAAALLLGGGVAVAVNPAIRVNGVQVTSLSTTTVQSGKQGVWVDNSTTPVLRYDDGTNSNRVEACVPTATGDYCSWNTVTGAWQRSAAPGGSATLASVYPNGASQTDETITEDATRLGPIIKGYSSQATSLLTLRQGSTPGANEDPLTVQDSTSTAVARIEVGGLYWANGQSGGYTADSAGAGATKYVSWIATNTTAATAGTPVQEADGFEINSKVWDTGSTTSKASAWHMYSTPVSGNPAFGQFQILHSLAGAADTNSMTLSTGTSNPSVATGVAWYGLSGTTPTLAPPSGGTIGIGSPLVLNGDTIDPASGATPASGYGLYYDSVGAKFKTSPGNTLFYSPVDASISVTPANSSGNNTTGKKYIFVRPVTVQGVRFYWSGANKTIRCRLYSGSTSLATGTVNTTGTGAYTCSFGSTYNVSGADVATTQFIVSTYETTGTLFQAAMSSTTLAAGASMCGQSVMCTSSTALFSTGDVAPTTSAGGEYPLEPIFITNP